MRLPPALVPALAVAAGRLVPGCCLGAPLRSAGALGVTGRIWLKLDKLPWDQAFDVLARVNGLAWTRTGDVIHVEPRRRGPSRCRGAAWIDAPGGRR